jgi:hypothetical protein
MPGREHRATLNRYFAPRFEPPAFKERFPSGRLMEGKFGSDGRDASVFASSPEIVVYSLIAVSLATLVSRKKAS